MNIKRTLQPLVDFEDEETLYFFGLLFAHASFDPRSFRHRFVLTKGEVATMKKLRKYLDIDDFITEYPAAGTTRHNYLGICITDMLSERLASLGIRRRKKEDSPLPSCVVGSECWRHWIRGFFDGKGSVTYQKQLHSVVPKIFISANKMTIYQLAKKIKHILGFDVSISQNSGNSYNLCICHKVKCKLFMDWLYNDTNLYMSSKYNKWNALSNQ